MASDGRPLFTVFSILFAHDCMLGAFHMAKVAQHCAGKYIKGSGFEDALVENKVFVVKVMESVLNGKHYVRSLILLCMGGPVGFFLITFLWFMLAC